MLEGMANHQARAVQARAGGLLLYAPVVRAEDFHSAIAYLVRRLDENTAPDNFLRHVFGLEPGSPEWDLERDRFLGAFDLVAALSDAPRRTQDRLVEHGLRGRGRSRGALRERARHGLGGRRQPGVDRPGAGRDGASGPAETVPLQIGGDFVAGAARVEGRDRSRAGAGRLSPRTGGPRAGAPRPRRRARRAGGLGAPARDGAPARCSTARRPCSRGAAGIWSAR